MVQGLAFLSKKSWHTKNKANQEKVWIAEEQKKAEEAKTKELAKQIQQEREQEEFDRIAGKKTLKDRGIDWIYQGGTTGELAKQDAEEKQEEFLLGKEYVAEGAVKGDFDDGQQQSDGIHNVVSKAAASSVGPTKSDEANNSMSAYGPVGATSASAATATASSSHLETGVASRNEDFRMRMEDPMFMVSQKQREKQQKHDKAKALYEKVVGSGACDASSAEEDDNDGDHRDRRHKKSKKDRKKRKKYMREKKKSSKRRRREDRSSDDDEDEDSYDRDPEIQRSRRSPSRSRSRSRSPSPMRHRGGSPSFERRHHRKRGDDDDDNNNYHRHDHHGGRHHHSRDEHHEHRSRDRDKDYRDNSYRKQDRRDPHGDRYSDRDRDHDRYEYAHRHQHGDNHGRSSRLKDPPKPAYDDGPKKREGYGLKGAPTQSVNPKDLGPSRDLLQKKQSEREDERRRIREAASSRKRFSQEDRKRALEEMQADARKRESHMYRQAMHRSEETEDEFGRAARGSATFLDDVHRNVFSGEGSGTLAARVAQNRHTQQRLHDAFL